MQNLVAGFLLAVFSLSFVPVFAKDFDVSRIKHKDYPAWFIDNSFLDLSDAVGEARAGGKKGLMVLFTTEGCSYCYLFNDVSLHNPDIAATVRANFDSVGMEIFDDAIMVSPKGKSMPIKEFARQEGVQYSPTLLFYDTEGNRVFGKSGYQAPDRFKTILGFVSNGHYKQVAFADYVKQQATVLTTAGNTIPLIENPAFQKPPHNLDRTRIHARLPLLLIFEQPGCGECREFHQRVLADTEVEQTLKKFDVVRLDASDQETYVVTPSGEKMSPAKWYREQDFSRVPALLLFDEKGEARMKTDALVLRERMINTLNYMLERAYEKDWTYQRFARSKSIARNLDRQKQESR